MRTCRSARLSQRAAALGRAQGETRGVRQRRPPPGDRRARRVEHLPRALAARRAARARSDRITLTIAPPGLAGMRDQHPEHDSMVAIGESL